MTKIIIVGSGAVAAELTSYIENQNQKSHPGEKLEVAGYLEFEENIKEYWAKYKFKAPVIGDIHTYSIQKDDHFIVSIANITFRQKMIDVLGQKDANVVGFVHHSAIVADTAVVESGNIIYPHCVIGPNSIIGKNNLFTSYSFVSHDCKIGSNNFFSTAGLSGKVIVGDHNFFGIRSTVLPEISIGSRNIIQAGMIVDKNISDDSTVFHRFKEKIIAIRNSE